MFGNQQAMDYAAINQQMGLPVAAGITLNSVIINQDDTYTPVIPESGPLRRKNYRTQYAFGNIENHRIQIDGRYIEIVQVFVNIRATPTQQQNHDMYLQVILHRANGESIITNRSTTQVKGCLAVNFTARCEEGSYITVEVYGRNGDEFNNGSLSMIGWPEQ